MLGTKLKAHGASLPEDVAAAFRRLSTSSEADEPTPVPLILGILDISVPELKQRLETRGPDALSDAERTALVTRLMLERNKVTHIYELIRAYGSSSQLRFDRGSKTWVRQDSIGAKHEREFAVDPLEGRYGSGPNHAPLIVGGDPRQSTPTELRRVLESALHGVDERVVLGWTQAIGPMEEG